MHSLRIGDLAERTGVAVATIRYYEQIGLLRPAARQAGGQRVYTTDDVERVTFIRRCRAFDFTIEQVRALVRVTQDRASSCTTARDLAASHLDEVRGKMRELAALEQSLTSFVQTCEATCVGGPGPDCSILAELGSSCGCGAGAKPARGVLAG